MTTTKTTAAKNIGTPDETRSFPKGRLDVVNVGQLTFGKATFAPGWRWTVCMKPLMKTELCMVHHNGYVVAGRMCIRMADGSETAHGPGDVFVCPPGHDAWVVGDEECVVFDFAGAADYAKPAVNGKTP